MQHPYKTTVSALLEIESQPKVALIIVNPNSGQRKGPKALAIIKPIFEEAGIKCRVFETTHRGHCGEICAKEDLSDVDILVPIGGDGTLHEASNGLMSRTDGATERITLAVIPAGSGNTFAFDVGINDVAQAAKVALAGKYKRIDLAQITTLNESGDVVEGKPPLYSINMIGWALPSKVMSTANSFRGCGCGAWYNFAINKYILSNDSYKAKVSYKLADGKEVTSDLNLAILVVQNTVHLGDKLPLSPEAKVDDGFLDLAIIKSTNIISNMRTFALSKTGMHVKRKQCAFYKCTEVTLLPSDGRLRGPNTVNVRRIEWAFSV